MPKKAKSDPPKCYIDACVFLSYIEGPIGKDEAERAVNEARLNAIDSLFADCEHSDRSGYTSHLSIAEVAFAAWEKTGKALDAVVEERIDKLWLPGSPFELAEVSEFVVRKARSIMRTAIQNGWSLKAHDAIHFAAAMRLEAKEFFTYDSKLYRFDKVLGFDVIPPYVGQGKLFVVANLPVQLPQPCPAAVVDHDSYWIWRTSKTRHLQQHRREHVLHSRKH